MSEQEIAALTAQRDELAHILRDIRGSAEASPWCAESSRCGWATALSWVRRHLERWPSWLNY